MSKLQHSLPRAPRRARTAFTMMEVLVAMAIFVVGFVAVAAIFPVAIRLQKATVAQMAGKQFAENAKATVITRGFEIPASSPEGEVFAFPSSALAEWSLLDRSYPAHVTSISDRRQFWVPLVIDTTVGPARTWFVYLFFVTGSGKDDYPKPAAFAPVDEWANPTTDPASVPGVAKIAVTVDVSARRFNFDNDPQIVFPLDRVVDNMGQDYTVTSAEDTYIVVDSPILVVPAPPTHIWAAHPGTTSQSTFVRLETLNDSSLIREVP